MDVYIKYPRACLYVNPGLTDVTTMRSIPFKINGIEFYVPSKFHCDCASVPVWWVATSLNVSAIGVIVASIWFYNPYFVAVLLGLMALSSILLWLRKANLLPVGIIHDAMYAGEVYNMADRHTKHKVVIARKKADEWFRRALIEYTMPRVPKVLRHVPAFFAWGAVRVFGFRRYYKN